MDLLLTKDGSHTLHSSQFNEIYHSRHGAIQESKHVFLAQGLDYAAAKFSNQSLNIFEVGFGTGLNALLTMLEADKRQLKIYYETIEPYPLPIETIKQLNYTAQLGFEFCYGPYHTLHLCRWADTHAVTPQMHFKKVQQSLLHTTLPDNFFHLIYFDAFAPQHQPEMWSVGIFEKMHKALCTDGALVTYCSKSEIQRHMRSAGFEVEKVQGPPGKREMIRAHKK